ncbi:hypothetical protein SESBI_32185 [Sesbania bispinosa]|nr:hypothetical protein SESBI_32185 [Sesbania bispinosa]
MRHFVAMKHPGYERITVEFLSYVSANIMRGKGDEHGKIKFRLNNEDHILTLETFSDIFGLPKGGNPNPHSLPDPECTTVRNRNNWTFHTAGPPPAAIPIEPPDRQHSNADDLHVALHELKIQQQVFMA